MVNKKGIIRTLEAIIAIVMVLLFIYMIMPKEQPTIPENSIKKYGDFIIKDLSYNDSIRSKLMDLGDLSVDGCNKTCVSELCNPACIIVAKDIDNLIQNTLTTGQSYFFKICNTASCVANVEVIPFEKTIYMFNVLMGSDSDTIQPAIIRTWIWEK